MATHTVTFHPGNRSQRIDSEKSLLEAASQAGITLNNLCGGDGICGRCKMVVKTGSVKGGITGRLTKEEIEGGHVLACMTFPESDIVAEIPEQALAKQKANVDGDAQRFSAMDTEADRIQDADRPLVQKAYLQLEKPSLADNRADHQRLCAAVRKRMRLKATRTSLAVMQALPTALHQADYRVTATVGMRAEAGEILRVEQSNTSTAHYVIVVDIGTTTVVAHLVDAAGLRTIDGRACFNSQGVHGREVTGRLMTAEKKGVAELQKLIVKDINELVLALAERNKVDMRNISAVVCAGNTAMSHFLLGLPVDTIRRTPYVACTVSPSPLPASEVGININPTGLLYSLPGISGWVGSDLTAGIIATGMHERKETSLLVDIGTNGEVIVGNREWLMACSASAGPALEGASVESGMRAEAGAIEKVWTKNGRICCKTIGDQKPKGICGSGIIDAVAVLLQKDIINRSGKIIASDPERVLAEDGIRKFVLARATECENNRPVTISEVDIENIVTAKAAIFAAMKILLQRLDMQFADIHNFYLAGAFGSHINIENAICIGLIPDIPRDRVHFVGNTSMKGAKIVALCQEAFARIKDIQQNTTYYDLMGANDYVDEFRKAMFLPHTDIEFFRNCGGGGRDGVSAHGK